MWEVCSFLGHARFYRRFKKEFQQNFPTTIQAAIEGQPNWDYPFELMLDASNSTLGVIIGQRVGVGKQVHVIAYASRTMDPTQLNYTTTEKELLPIVFALDKFRSCLLGSKIIVFFDHAALRFLLKKPNAKL
ncbi:Retrovirus-related Pol polyprotein, partial [Mucuna pruriens]